MRKRQTTSLKKAIMEKYPQFKDIERLSKLNLTDQEKQVLNDLKSQYKKIYKKGKKIFKNTSNNNKNVIIVK